MSSNDRRGYQIALTATTAPGQWAPLATWRETGAFVEVVCQDAFVSVQATQKRDGVSNVEYARLGPAGSSVRFVVDEYVEIAYRVEVLLTTRLVDPMTGLINVGTAVPSLSATLQVSEPAVDRAMILRCDGDDTAAIAAAGTTALAYPPGYATVCQITCVPVVSGSVTMTSPGGTIIGSVPLQGVIEFPVHAFDRISIVNDSAATTQPLVLRWLHTASNQKADNVNGLAKSASTGLSTAKTIFAVGAAGDQVAKSCTLSEVWLALTALTTTGQGLPSSVTWYLAADSAGDEPITPSQTDAILIGATTSTSGSVSRSIGLAWKAASAGSIYLVVALNTGTATATAKLAFTSGV